MRAAIIPIPERTRKPNCWVNLRLPNALLIGRSLITGERKHLEPVPRLRTRTAEALHEAEKMATTEQE